MRWASKKWFADSKEYSKFKTAVRRAYSRYIKSKAYKVTRPVYRIKHSWVQDTARDIMAEFYHNYGNEITLSALKRELNEVIRAEVEDRTFTSHPVRQRR